jgi:hypothetical protein
MLFFLDDWLFLNRLKIKFLCAGKVIYLVIIRKIFSEGWLLAGLLLFLSNPFDQGLVNEGVRSSVFFHLGVVLIGLKRLLGVADVDEAALLYIASAFLNLEAIIADIAKGKSFGMILREVSLIDLISVIGGIVWLVCEEVGTGQIDVIIGKLASLKLDGGINLVAAHIFRFILIVDIELVILFFPCL